MRATIEWSYELLGPAEQQVFRRFAVFRGGASLEAIEAVVDATSDLVEALIDKSLVRRRLGRFVMLETIREFARDEIDASEEGNEARRRHAHHYAAVADGANLDAGNLRPGGQRLDVALAEQDNIRAALSWAIAAGEIAVGLRIAAAMEQFWVVNDPSEGTRWFSALFDSAGDDDAVDPGLRARALRAWGSSAGVAGDSDAATDFYSRSLALHEQLGDDHGRAVLLHRLGIMAMLRGELERARALVLESHAIHKTADDTWGLAQTIGTLGALARDAGDSNEAYELIGESAALALEPGSSGGTRGCSSSWPRFRSRRGASTTPRARLGSRSRSLARSATTAAGSSASESLPPPQLFAARSIAPDGSGARSRTIGSGPRSVAGFGIERGAKRASPR